MIEIDHLTKRYGTHTAVSDLSFQVESGRIYGFLGPNGAGKSTTMNIMTGCLSATEGHVKIGGHDIFEEPEKAKRLIGYLPEQPPLYLNETPAEYLCFVGEAKGLRGAALSRQVEAVMDQVKITDVRNRRVSALSKGYRQRTGIAQALLGDPKVIVLDEPTAGLDPIQIIEIRDLMKDLGRTHTVIFSSHILSEAQALCDQILIINHGKLIAFDEAENLEKLLLSPNEITVLADAAEPEVRDILRTVSHITDTRLEKTEAGYVSARLTTDCRDVHDLSRAVFSAFAASGAALLELSVRRANLEDVFVELTESGPGEPPGEEIQTGKEAAAHDSGMEA